MIVNCLGFFSSRYQRATSCEEGFENQRLKVKGILKKRKSMEDVHR
jgi:hypothetical protein